MISKRVLLDFAGVVFISLLRRHGVAATYCEVHPNVLKRFALSEGDEV